MTRIERVLSLVAIAVLSTGCAGWRPPAASAVRENVRARAAFDLACERPQVEILYHGEMTMASIWYLGAVGCERRAIYASECSGEFCVTRRWVRTPLLNAPD